MSETPFSLHTEMKVIYLFVFGEAQMPLLELLIEEHSFLSDKITVGVKLTEGGGKKWEKLDLANMTEAIKTIRVDMMGSSKYSLFLKLLFEIYP
jgi:hypothetical protein